MSEDSLKSIIQKFDHKKIICFGDVMLDRFVYGSVSRTSPEAPIPVLLIDHEQSMLGGAGNAAANLKSLGAQPLMIGLIGQDSAGDTLTRLCEQELGSSDGLISIAEFPTIEKTRFLAANQQMLRVDREDAKYKLSDTAQAKIKETIDRLVALADGVLISDYAKGLVTEELCQYLIQAANKRALPILVDPKGTDFTKYNGSTVIKPNKKELFEVTKVPCKTDEEVDTSATALLNTLSVDGLIVTRSEDGISVITKDQDTKHIRTNAKDVFDVSGAGDTVGATILLSITSGGTLEEATEIGNIAGGIVVGKIGTAKVHPDDLLEELLALDSVSKEHSLVLPGLKKLSSKKTILEKVNLWRAQGLKIGFTNGYFDLIHPGHLSLFEQAKSRCDKLIVAVNSDTSVKANQREDSIIQDEISRAAVLGALEFADSVILFDERSPIELICAINPDVLIKGGNYQVSDVLGHEFVLSQGKDIFIADIDKSFGKRVSDLKRAG